MIFIFDSFISQRLIKGKLFFVFFQRHNIGMSKNHADDNFSNNQFASIEAAAMPIANLGKLYNQYLHIHFQGLGYSRLILVDS